MRDGAKTPGKVAIYSTCYVNYNEPGIGHDLMAILDHNEIPYVVVEKEACCGMPKLEIGDLESVERLKNINIPPLATLAREGYAIVTAVPSCTLMYKQELPLMFPDDADVQLVKEAMWDPFEYLVARKRDGLLKADFKKPLGTVSYHVPCHGRVQNVGRKTEETVEVAAGYHRQHGRALLGALGRVGNTQGVSHNGDEDRQAGFQEHGERQARLRQLGLPACRSPYRAGH